MSNKPKIYANCKSGCLWETVHKSDFERSAAFIKQYPNENGEYILEEGKTYIVRRAPNASQMGYYKINPVASDDFYNPLPERTLNIPYPDSYSAYDSQYKFRLLYVTWNFGQKWYDVTGCYEIDGNKLYPSFEYSIDTDIENIIHSVVVTGASEVLLVNEHAEIRAKDAYEIAVEEGFVGTRAEWASRFPKGDDGKSAYQYAKEMGYTGTEDAFAEDINPDNIKAEANAYITEELAKRGQLKPEFIGTFSELEASGDQTKMYVLPDGYIYAYMLVTHAGGEPLFTNQLPRAIDKDGSIYNGKGFKEGTGIASANGAETSNSLVTVTGFIKAKKDDVIRVKGFTRGSNANISLGYDENFAKYGATVWPEEWADAVDGVYTFNAPGHSNTIYIRIAVKTIADDAIVTVNEEIKYGEPTSYYQWASTGRQFVPADYDDRIFSLEADSKDHLRRITVIEKVIESGDLQNKTDEEKINGFRYWDRAIYDKIPTYTLSDEAKEAVSDSMRTNTAIYQKYDELMTLANSEWQYVTKTLLGQDEAGFDVYRYDFKMPDIPTVVASTTSKAVPKVILVSGVHPEWAGIYALYNTMYEITTNPDLIDLKRNVHFIVVPMVNAYSCNTGNRKNINGIDIARNFEVDFIKQTDTTLSTYGGTEPLSELEAYYVDKIMNENQDALFFASCHNFFNDEPYNRCMWGAAATRYFSNVCQKLIDKLTREWASKYSYVPKSTYLGHTGISAPNGSEGMQALKYGIQGGTLECRCNFPYHSTTSYTSFSQTRATEVYINFLLTALGNFEACDKRELKDYDGKL